MDKSQADQLNRAYEAYRQACMDKERFKKELQQKKEFYEQQSREHKKQIEGLKNHVFQLTSQLTALNAAGVHKLPQSPKLENKDSWKSDPTSNLSLEQLEQQLRAITQREKHYKEQLDSDKLQFLEMKDERDKLISALSSKNEEVQHLKTRLKEANERRERQDSRTVHGHEAEMRNKNMIPDVSAAPVASENERQSIERVFSDVKEQFSRICKLTRKQSRLLKGEIASDPTLEFSMPIQCTDEDSKETEILPKPVMTMGLSHFAPITPRGLTPDDDLTVSVESLSNLSIKFPPSTDNSEFLQSSTEGPPVLPVALEQNTNSSKIQVEAPPKLRKFSTAVSSPPYSPRSPRTVCHMDNVKVDELGPNYKDTFVGGAEDSSLFLAANSPSGKYTIAFHMPDIPNLDGSIEVAERTVRGPQQPVWKPSSHQDDDPSIAVGEKWDRDSSDICEFCQAVFPPSSRAKAEFLRHLNSHFQKII
ncbi:PREDICTED: TRAF family member-associated NF-kappa-B activator [Nanorana parkeri]|uniref:TRAF family member-associated NF-kappa-B activator n=1 Tax=Nanorana parkeri TaxID=125878 RepID=UPI000853F31D|nr:PREDICTED: TRAF family member-associated NF-kappa-B activator [Nanorana parkeri]